MGCDIHVRTEVRRYRDEARTDGIWISADTFKVNPDHFLYGNDERYEVEEIYTGRDYNLFSILADVRNYYAGTRRVVPISKPKGFPDDASDETKSSYEHWRCDAHSASWYTLQELLNNKDRFTETEFIEAIDKLQSLTRNHPYPQFEIKAEDVRIVFWFDN